MLKRPHYIALGIVAVLTVIVLSLPHHTTAQLKLAISSLFLPLFGLSRSSQQLTSKAGDALTTRAELLKENEILRQTNMALQLRLAQAEAAQRENAQLRQSLAFQARAPWNVKAANVIGRGPANWWLTVQIDRGSLDGVRTNMVVVAPSGVLVGRISEVGTVSASVALVGSPACKVPALIEQTRESGVIVGGAGPLDLSLATMSYLTGNAAKPGQAVYTSEVSRVFPPNILIGQIAENPEKAELGYRQVRVKLAANLGTLGEVFVIMK